MPERHTGSINTHTMATVVLLIMTTDLHHIPTAWKGGWGSHRAERLGSTETTGFALTVHIHIQITCWFGHCRLLHWSSRWPIWSGSASKRPQPCAHLLRICRGRCKATAPTCRPSLTLSKYAYGLCSSWVTMLGYMLRSSFCCSAGGLFAVLTLCGLDLCSCNSVVFLQACRGQWSCHVMHKMCRHTLYRPVLLLAGVFKLVCSIAGRILHLLRAMLLCVSLRLVCGLKLSNITLSK